MVSVQRTWLIVTGAAVLVAGCTSRPPEIPEAVRKKIQDVPVQSPFLSGPTDRSANSERESSNTVRGGRGVLRTRDELTVSETASVALGRIGEAAVPALAQSLHHSQPAIRRQAAETLARVGPAAAPAVSDLVRTLSDEDPLVRRAAARALGQIGPAAAAAVPALLRIMQERDE